MDRVKDTTKTTEYKSNSSKNRLESESGLLYYKRDISVPHFALNEQITDMGVYPGEDGGEVLPKFGLGEIIILMPAQRFCLLCAFLHMILWYNAVTAFPPELDACTIKLGESVPDILRHSGSDPQTLRWIDAIGYRNIL